MHSPGSLGACGHRFSRHLNPLRLCLRVVRSRLLMFSKVDSSLWRFKVRAGILPRWLKSQKLFVGVRDLDGNSRTRHVLGRSPTVVMRLQEATDDDLRSLKG